MLAPDIGYRLAHHDDLGWAASGRGHGDRRARDDRRPGRVRVPVGPTDHRPVEPTVGYRIDQGAPPSCSPATRCRAPDSTSCAVGADVYVQTVLRDDLVRQVPMPRMQDTIDYHSTVEQAAQTAARAGVRHAGPHPPGPDTRAGERRGVDCHRGSALRRHHRVRRGPDERRLLTEHNPPGARLTLRSRRADPGTSAAGPSWLAPRPQCPRARCGPLRARGRGCTPVAPPSCSAPRSASALHR